MTDPRRIGIFGGTFDPIHRAHLAVAEAARDHADLDLVLFMVAGVPPHKRDEVLESATHRYELVEAAVAGLPGMEASRLEIDRDGPSYTVDTLAVLRETYPGARLYLIIGEDSLVDLPKWRATEGILDQAELLVVPRPDARGKVPASLQDRYTLLPFREDEISSTEVRRRLEEGVQLNGMLPDPVERLIHQRGYYHAHR